MRGNSLRAKLIVFCALILFLSLVGGVWIAESFLKSPSIVVGDVIFETLPGENIRSVGRRLQNENLISNHFLFFLYAKFTGQAARVKVGQYLLKMPMTPDQILATLVSGVSIARPVTIPEGYNIFDIADAIESETTFKRKEFLARALDTVYSSRLLRKYLPSSFHFEESTGKQLVSTLEGYLFPDTYLVTKYTTIDELIGRMVQRFAEEFVKIKATVAPAAPLKLADDKIVTFASIVEKETAAVDERPHIAGVFYNRLEKQMLLQTDPTVLYAKMRRTHQLENNITRLDLHTDDPYNTYSRKGLPPGPIASPGRAALIAVLQPVKTNSLYFVSRNDGTHVFSDNLSAHDEAVQKYQVEFFRAKRRAAAHK